MRLATRASALALAQSGAVAKALGGAELVEITREREAGSAPDAVAGDKARFVRGVEEALLAGEADLGVHSAKDLPGNLLEGLELVGVTARQDPLDAYVGEAADLASVPRGARVGTASLRRRSQLLAARPDLEVVELRGNVDTRLARLAAGEYDGIVLAAAGLARLGREDEIGFRFDPAQMTPAAGQGIVALEARAGDEVAAGPARELTDRSALIELTAECAAVAALGASCDTPVGIGASFAGAELELSGYAGLPDGGEWVRDGVRGDPEQPAALGEALAERMLAAGAGGILERAAAAA